jgi:hypothetical protein
MLGDAPAWLWFALLVTPGWFAMRGWSFGRVEPLPTPLSEWLPLALAISASWSGVLAFTAGPSAAELVVRGPTAVRIAAWLAVAAVLWLVPFGFGWLVGRTRTNRRGQPVTIVLKSGSTISGRFHKATATDLVLADAVWDGVRYEAVTVGRCDAELVLRGPAVTAPPLRDE